MGTNSAVAELKHLLSVPPPNLPAAHANNPIAVAHASLEALRDGGDEQFLFWRSILELVNANSGEEELLFHAVTGCRQVVLWRWKHFSFEFTRALRDGFVSLGHHLGPARRSCQLACYTTAVSFWKRGWTETAADAAQIALRHHELALLEGLGPFHPVSIQSKPDLFLYLEDIFSRNQTMLQAATFLNCLVGEFSGKSAVQYRLPLEFHKEAHHSFEREGALNQSLKLSMKALGQVVNNIMEFPNQIDVATAQAVAQLTMDIISWEFGLSAWDTGSVGASTVARTILRPPVAWKEFLIRPEFCGAIFHVHEMVQGSHPSLAQSLRQLLLLLASFSGPMFADKHEKQQFALHLLDGSFKLIQNTTQALQPDTAFLPDTFQLIARIMSNFGLTALVELPNLTPLLQQLTTIGTKLLTDQVQDCETAGGDSESMEYRDWREECLSLLLDSVVLLCNDPYILYSGTEQSRKSAQISLSAVLGPLYESFVRCRTRIAALEEYYIVSNEAEFDDVREEIIEARFEEELTSVAALGRLNLPAAISCLSASFSNTLPRLQGLWDGSGDVTPDAAALLEETRLLIVYVSHLLTDDNEGESPAIPEAVMLACQENGALASDIAAAVETLFNFANAQVQKIAQNPLNYRLSPLLARSMLWFLTRWAPAYVCASVYSPAHAGNRIVTEWASPDKAQRILSFCVSLCLSYNCYWPHETQVQEVAGKLMLSLAKRGEQVRGLLISSTAFHQMVHFHCLTAAIRHNAVQAEFDASVRSMCSQETLPPMDMLRGYQRLPYKDRARILTVILVACSDESNDAANAMTSNSLKAVHDAFSSLIGALSNKTVAVEDISTVEMACLCIELFTGVAHAVEMNHSDRIPALLTGYLLQLSGLMNYYATELPVCEALLRFFRDYTEQFVALLDKDQSLVLFNASAELLRSYSRHHCESREIKKSAAEALAEEEQAYSDISCAIQLLVNLGAKDFIDACNAQAQGVDTTQVTDMIFFGLQQILPLMTQGLLQFPTLCSQFFELVGFMMDTYPDKVCSLPLELFQSLLDSLLFGMTHHDVSVARSSLHGLASIAREESFKSRILVQQPDILDKCYRRILAELVFQSIVVDRLEAAALAFLPLAAVDINRFAAVIQEFCTQLSDEQQVIRLQTAFKTLLPPDVLTSVSKGGMEGRMHRARFKKSFEEFVNDVHSFLVLK